MRWSTASTSTRASCRREAIGHRALAVNLSDLAAMGARPRAALLSLALPAALPLDALDGFMDGFVAHAATQQVAVVGGNITRTAGPLVVNVTAMGACTRGACSGAAGRVPATAST